MSFEKRDLSGVEKQKTFGPLGGLKEKEKASRNECIIEYHAGRSMICVKYVTSIELNIENNDVLMFHCNYMSTQFDNISLEFYEKATKSKKKDKFLTFKTISYISPPERVLLKILTMIDLVIVYAKLA